MKIEIKTEDLADIFFPIITMDKDFNFDNLVKYNDQLFNAIDKDKDKINDSYLYKLGVFVYHNLKSILNKIDSEYIMNQSYVIREAIWLFYKADYSENDLIDIGKTALWSIDLHQHNK